MHDMDEYRFEEKGAEKKRRKREVIIMIAIAFLIGLAVLGIIRSRAVTLGTTLPVSSSVLIFVLININLLLILLLIFLVIRNVVKLYYERKRKVAGAKLRTKLLLAFITLTLMPTIVLFFFSIHFISNSLAFWFNIPVEQVLENAASSTNEFYTFIEEENGFHVDRLISQAVASKIDFSKVEDVSAFTRKHMLDLGLDVVEMHDREGRRVSISKGFKTQYLDIPPISPSRLKKNADRTAPWSDREITGKYEIVRTTGVAKISGNQVYLSVTTLLPLQLGRSLDQVDQGLRGYRNSIAQKKPVQFTYYIALSVVALLVVFCAMWFAIQLSRTITIPLMDLAEGTRRLAEGDFNVQIQNVADDEIGTLIESFNKMTRDIGIAREQLSLSSRMLHQQNTEIEERRRYMEIVLKNVSTGVVSIDPSGLIATINKSAERMLGIQAKDVLRKDFRTILPPEASALGEKVMQDLKSSHDGIRLPVNLKLKGGPKSFIAFFNMLTDDAGNHIGVLAVFDDVTELERAQRMAAWREVARRIAHEVKNPLTPLSLSAQRLRRKYPEMLKESVFDECTRTIINHVDLIRNLVNEFSTYARFPTANPSPCLIQEIIAESVALYKEGFGNIEFVVDADPSIPTVNLDRRQIRQALINLFENAITAMKGQGGIKVSARHDVLTRSLVMEVEDTGPGIADDDKPRVFEPYFSTKKSGTGLGLTIVNSIVNDHKGVIRVHNAESGGAKFVMEFPA